MNAPFDQETGEIADTLSPPPMASFRMSGDMGPLFTAKAKARPGYTPIVKDKSVKVTNKEGKYLYTFVYADLGAVIAATERALSENGLDLMWFLSDAVEGKMLRCILAHESGAFIESAITIPPGDSPQELGSALTYARRYQAQCVLGVAPEDDDDGSAAGGKVAIPQEKPQAARPEPRREAPAPAPKPETKPAPTVAQAPAQAALPAVALAPIKPASAPPGPISPQVTKPVAGEPLEEELKKALSAHFVALGMRAATEKATVCKVVTGVSPAELTRETAEKLLGYLKIQAAEKGIQVAA